MHQKRVIINPFSSYISFFCITYAEKSFENLCFVTVADNADVDVPMDTTQANSSNLDNSKTSSSRNGKLRILIIIVTFVSL